MAFWVNIQNGKVAQCRDSDPSGDPDWIPAIEVRPALGANQRRGDHYFDITKQPVEIVWPVVDMTAAEIEANRVSGIHAQITALEATVTNRRIREAIRGSGKVWLDNIDDQIAALRAQLPV